MQLLTNKYQWVREFGKWALRHSFAIDYIQQTSSGYFLKRGKWNYTISKAAMKVGEYFQWFGVYYSADDAIRPEEISSLIEHGSLLAHIQLIDFQSLDKALHFILEHQ